MAIPAILLAIALVALSGASIGSVIIAITIPKFHVWYARAFGRLERA